MDKCLFGHAIIIIGHPLSQSPGESLPINEFLINPLITVEWITNANNVPLICLFIRFKRSVLRRFGSYCVWHTRQQAEITFDNGHYSTTSRGGESDPKMLLGNFHSSSSVDERNGSMVLYLNRRRTAFHNHKIKQNSHLSTYSPLAQIYCQPPLFCYYCAPLVNP